MNGNCIGSRRGIYINLFKNRGSFIKKARGIKEIIAFLKIIFAIRKTPNADIVSSKTAIVVALSKRKIDKAIIYLPSGGWSWVIRIGFIPPRKAPPAKDSNVSSGMMPGFFFCTY